jgi:hypothetical protein
MNWPADLPGDMYCVFTYRVLEVRTYPGTGNVSGARAIDLN